MAYDFDAAADVLPPTPNIVSADPRDLEPIVTLLKIAALYLTKGPESDFTVDELIKEAHRIGGEEVQIKESDVNIVLGNVDFLKKKGDKRLRLK